MQTWTKFQISTDFYDLALELSSAHGQKLILTVDSGADDGVKLGPESWRQWKSAHPNQPITLEAYYTPNPGLVVAEESWADKISLGSLTLTNVPVMESDSTDLVLHTLPNTRYEGTLAYKALKRLDLVIDGGHGFAYLRPKMTPTLSYVHNRLGAVFMPQNLQSNDLVAHVVAGSPAYEAGIRNDDVLLSIGELDVTKWRTDPAVLPLSRFWSSPPGTKHELTLRRGDKIYNTSVILRNIVPPDSQLK